MDRTDVLNIRVNDEWKRRLRSGAASHGTTMTTLVMYAVDEVLKDEAAMKRIRGITGWNRLEIPSGEARLVTPEEEAQVKGYAEIGLKKA